MEPRGRVDIISINIGQSQLQWDLRKIHNNVNIFLS